MTEAPERTAMYRIRGEADALLYIGVSDDFGRRWKQHAKKQPWWHEMRSLSVDCWYESRPEAEAAEAAAIKAEQPKYNKTHNVPVLAAPSAGRPAHAVEGDKFLGYRIRELRQARGMSQATLAQKMTQLDWPWHQATVYRTEAGNRPAGAGEVIDLADIFGVPLESFLPSRHHPAA